MFDFDTIIIYNPYVHRWVMHSVVYIYYTICDMYINVEASSVQNLPPRYMRQLLSNIFIYASEHRVILNAVLYMTDLITASGAKEEFTLYTMFTVKQRSNQIQYCSELVISPQLHGKIIFCRLILSVYRREYNLHRL